MRCPKCGYISFDHVETCLKCKKKIKRTNGFDGTVHNVSPPGFLKFEEPEPIPEETLFEEDGLDPDFDQGDDIDIVDPDLQILLDDNDEGKDLDLSESENDLAISLDEDEEEMNENEEDFALDLNQFEEIANEHPDDSSEFAMDFPEELTDLSDLEPETVSTARENGENNSEEEATQMNGEEEDDPFLDDLNFDLDLDLDSPDLTDEKPESAMEEASREEGLSMDSLKLEDSHQNEKKLDMDEELNFELDLGGLTLNNK